MRTYRKVTIKKIKSTLRRSGLSEKIQSMLLADMEGDAQTDEKPVKLKRLTIKKIGLALAQGRQCGLYLNRNGLIVVVGAGHVRFNSFEAGRKNLTEAASRRHANGAAAEHSSQTATA